MNCFWIYWWHSLCLEIVREWSSNELKLWLENISCNILKCLSNCLDMLQVLKVFLHIISVLSLQTVDFIICSILLFMKPLHSSNLNDANIVWRAQTSLYKVCLPPKYNKWNEMVTIEELNSILPLDILFCCQKHSIWQQKQARLILLKAKGVE